MAYKMKPLPHGTTLESLFTHGSASYRQVARMFFDGYIGTAGELAEAINVSKGSAWATTKAFKESNLIYIVQWTRPEGTRTTTYSPVYQAGNQPHAPKPKPKDPTQVERNRKHREAMKAKQLEEERRAYKWQGIAEALVPQRTEQERNEVNRMYLNWISEGVYG